MECSELKKHYDVLKTDRANVEGTWDIIEKFVVPYRGRFFTEDTTEGSIDWRKRDIFDSTAIIACQNLAANMHSNLTNPSMQWFDLKFSKPEANESHEGKLWMEKAVDVAYEAIQESNFNLEANEVYLDLPSFGEGFISEEIEESSPNELKSIDFKAMPLYQCYAEYDTNGKPVKFFRKLMWTANQIVGKFGEENCPQDIVDKAKNPTGLTEKLEVVYAVYFKRGFEKVNTWSVLAPEARPFGYKYFLHSSGEPLGEEGGYYEMPVFIPKWRKTSGSDHGHSPAMVSLSDILTLNQLVALILRSATKAIDPPLMTTRKGVFGNVNVDASGITVVNDMKSLAPLNTGARIDIGHLEKADIQQSIREAFYMDQLQLKDSPAMTATEVQVRYQLMQRLLGPTLGRLEEDFLKPLVERTIKILVRYGKIPPIPEKILAMEADLDVVFIGPMAKSQKFDEVVAIERWLGNIEAMAQMFPKVTMLVDEMGTAREIGHAVGVPTRLMRSKTAVAAEETKRNKENEELMKLQATQMAGDAAKAVGEGRQAMAGSE